MESGEYKKLACREELEVEAFYSIHYFQYMSSFYFPGERHGFWEFVCLKIETAKEYIRNEKMNFSQIAEKLGYSSQHYFSRQFKSVTGMTPTEYASSIRAMAEKEKET